MVDDHETASSPVDDHETGNVSDKELVALLRINVPYEAPRCLQAADRIEALSEEVEKWVSYTRETMLMYKDIQLEERAAIVAWLREQDGYGEWYECADQIEAGEHLPKPFTRSDDV